MRYVIAYLLPPEIETQIRQKYLELSGQFLTIEHLHLSIIPTFLTDTPLSQIQSFMRQRDRSSTCAFTSPQFFTTLNKSILYLPVIPPEPFQILHTALSEKLSSFISYDLSLYNDHQLPPYIPHITLDYDFKGNPETAKTWSIIPPGNTYNLDHLVLFGEKSPNHWEVMA